MKPVLLDLFCGAGGAAMGYHRAGFEVVGVDIAPQPRYPFGFVQRDALSFDPESVTPFFDAIHASPPCQGYSDLAACHPGIDYPKLVGPVRDLLQGIGLPYVIENVQGAPLIDPVTLCATSWHGTDVEWNGRRYGLQRHRLFETNWPPPKPDACIHTYKAFPVYGHGYPNNMPWFRGAPMAKMAREVMGIDWMTRDELCEAIPPAYTEYIGKFLLDAIKDQGKEAA